jgi:ABC-type branched-subunit amino acid transport system substrate-binding protein
MLDNGLKYMFSKKLIISLLIIITIISFVFIYISFQHPVIGVLYEVGSRTLQGVEDAKSDSNSNIEIMTQTINNGDLEEAIEKFVNEGVKIIIGPKTSSHASSLIPLLEEYDLYAIASAVTSPFVIGKSNRFCTMGVSDDLIVEAFAKEVAGDGIAKVIIFKGTVNKLYNDYFAELFSEKFIGDVLDVISVDDPFNTEIPLETATEADAALMIMNPKKTGVMLKRLEKHMSALKYYAVDYSVGTDFYEYGGQYVSKVKVGLAVSPGISAEEMDPNYIGGYEAFKVVEEIYEKNINPEEFFSSPDEYSFEGYADIISFKADGSSNKSVRFFNPKPVGD